MSFKLRRFWLDVMLSGKLNELCLSLVVVCTITSLVYLNANAVYAQPSSVSPKVVHAGEGNATSVGTSFVPQKIEIKAGESVMWDNPTAVSEPHSVTFLKNDKFFPEFAAPFMVSNSTEFKSPDPNSNAEPLIAPPQSGETTKTVIMINARAYTPVVIDSTGKNITHLPPNSNYTMDGTESIVNSGWLWPDGQAPPGGPSINKFTITFEKSGTYNYVCNVHPWMKGTVKVN
jgi:plastocyanin